MSFEFKCPNCNHVISEKDFKENDKILNHLSEIFKGHRTEYIRSLKEKLEEKYQEEQVKEIKLALSQKEQELTKSYQSQIYNLNQVIANQKITVSNNDARLKQILLEKENQLLKENQKQLDKLNQIIAEQNNQIENNQIVLDKALAEHENQLNQTKNQEINQLQEIIANQKNKLESSNLELEKTLSQHETKLNQQKYEELEILKTKIHQLEEEKKSQKLMLDNLLTTKENELMKQNHEQISKLQEIIANQKSKLESSSLELEKTLSQHEVKLTQQKHNEILVLKDRIQELEKANQQFKVIQNKIKGENFEHEIEAELRKTFEPDDIISKITAQDKKADYLQEVRQDNNIIGKIVYEVKNAEWSNNWEKKLVDDMAKQNSKYGILIATSFNSKYPGIPFKRSDYNPNIYLTDSESFYFVGQILKTLIKIEYRFDNNRDKTDYNEKINQFNEWKATQLPKLDTMLNESLTKIDRLADLITDRAQDIKKEKAKVYKTWIKSIKDYLENFIF